MFRYFLGMPKLLNETSEKITRVILWYVVIIFKYDLCYNFN